MFRWRYYLHELIRLSECYTHFPKETGRYSLVVVCHTYYKSRNRIRSVMFILLFPHRWKIIWRKHAMKYTGNEFCHVFLSAKNVCPHFVLATVRQILCLCSLTRVHGRQRGWWAPGKRRAKPKPKQHITANISADEKRTRRLIFVDS